MSCLSVCLSVRPSVRPSVRLYVCLSVCDTRRPQNAKLMVCIGIAVAIVAGIAIWSMSHK
jgi:hypothetical protein